ncbi:MAG TPA: hypothetical protein VMC84_08255 [Methanocella sp.]|uniref:hypothetical protein n=1 Tax=Methanocella sp. TaxID=2052833 RepID=UPI002BFF6CF1|nr:hypothetical protein [Methanocella sp.]HTY91151.1 hypothetical protein [Methanocella sp.]
MIDDRGVSELMGYTVIVAVVSIASVALLAGSMGTLSQSEKSLEYKGSISSLRLLDNVVAGTVQSNNTFDTAFEMSVPSGCDLVIRDRHDDFRSVSIYSDTMPLAFIPLGSAAITSPFRSVTFEGGAVISNDTGLANSERRLAIHTAVLPSGKKALYMSLTSISGASFIRHSGPVTVYVKCNSSAPLAWHIPDSGSAVIYVRSGDPSAWQAAFEECGFSVTHESGALKAVSAGVSDIFCSRAEVCVHE